MVVLHFTTRLRDPSRRAEHEAMVRQMRDLAQSIPGFLGWYERPGEDSAATGVLVFDSEESLAAWRDDPIHGRIHQQGEESVYAAFDVTVLEPVRRNSWAL